MKKILFIMPSLLQGGAEKVLIDLLKYLDYSRYDVDLLLICEIGSYLKEVPDHVHLYFLLKKRYLRIFNLLHRIRRCLHLPMKYVFGCCLWAWRFKHKKYDVVVSFMEGESLILHSFIQRTDCLNISWVHTDLYTYHRTAPMFQSLEEETSFYSKMDQIICVAQNTKSMFHACFGLPNEKVQAIYNLMDKSYIQSSSKAFAVKKEKFTICFAGSLGKKADRLVRVARLFKDQGYDVVFWFVGGPGEKEALEVLSQELGVDRHCRFWGYQKNPYPWMNVCDIFVSTSAVEGFSLVISEALCLGKPVVSTATTGSIELLNNGEYGLLTEHDDDSIFQALRRLVDEPEWLHYYELQAQKRSQIFDVQQTLHEIYDLFDKKAGAVVTTDILP